MTELIRRTDSQIRIVTASVLECVENAGRFHVVPERTVIYPGGGGQPADSGTLDGYPILKTVSRKDGAIEHIVTVPLSGKVTIEVDWEKRLDCMQQHTAQHLMTALAGSLNGWKTLSFHLADLRSDIEFEEKDISENDLAVLERAVNQVILDDVPVTTRFVSRQEMKTMNVRSRLLPDGLEGPFRLVEIEDIDLNTCGGTHVASTGQMQVIKILGKERLTRGTRVFYAAGSRVLQQMNRLLRAEKEIGACLTTGPDDFLNSIESLKKSNRDLEGANRDLSSRLAAVVVERMAGDVASGQIAVYHHDVVDGIFLRQVAEGFRAVCPDSFALLTGGVNEGLFMLAGPEETVAALGPAVAKILDGRGGGRGGIFQGRADSLSLWVDALSVIRSHPGAL